VRAPRAGQTLSAQTPGGEICGLTPTTTAYADLLKIRKMERQTRKVLITISVLAALACILQLGVMLWSRHEMTTAETLVALHSFMFSNTGQLY